MRLFNFFNFCLFFFYFISFFLLFVIFTRKSTVKIYQCKKWMGGFLTKYKTTEWLQYNKFQIALRKVKTKCITTHSTSVLVMYDDVV